MNIKGFRRMLFGEKMPDKNDPKYKDRYEREVSAGRKFAQATRIDKAAAKVQGFANAHRSACYPRSTFYPLSDVLSIQKHRITML